MIGLNKVDEVARLRPPIHYVVDRHRHGWMITGVNVDLAARRARAAPGKDCLRTADPFEAAATADCESLCDEICGEPERDPRAARQKRGVRTGAADGHQILVIDGIHDHERFAAIGGGPQSVAYSLGALTKDSGRDQSTSDRVCCRSHRRMFASVIGVSGWFCIPDLFRSLSLTKRCP